MVDQPPQQPLQTPAGPGAGVIATVLILLVGLITLQVMSLQQSSEALKVTHTSQQKMMALVQTRTEKAIAVSQQALVMAGAARPDPYTGADARADGALRRAERRIEHASLLEDISNQLALVEARTNVKIGALDIPPKSVRDLLAALTRQGIRNEKAILVLSLSLDQLSPESKHVHARSLLKND